MIEEFGSYENVCLVTTSRMYPDIHGFHRVKVPTPTESGARDIFYSLCNLARTPKMDTLITKLDFHLFSIELLARTIRENSWDEQTLLKMWDDPKGMLRTTYYEALKSTIEPVFRSPRMKELGTVARDVLEAIASFQSGVEEEQLEGIFCGTGRVREVVDVLCRFSLVYRRNGVLKMLSPLQFYFLDGGYVPLLDLFRGCRLNIFKVSPYGGGRLPDYMIDEEVCRPEAPRKRKWIRRLPQMVKKRLIAFFSRRKAPTAILIDIEQAPAGTPPPGLRESPANIPATGAQQESPEIPPSVAQEDPTNSSPVATQEYVATIPLIVPRQQIQPAPVAYDMD
ncbi:hypothetical protein BJ322DRAFT_1026656 [Thelephora terrestris]|uniref:Uncharacterized protein n=1 Tax=Thelephora terrestris TaxID=56493 RepID=A0A9P6HP95_9AGAM|nr:hypothetical protein BJ322DRAFT_1026656 [Thelephora terrestris]